MPQEPQAPKTPEKASEPQPGFAEKLAAASGKPQGYISPDIEDRRKEPPPSFPTLRTFIHKVTRSQAGG